MKMKLMLRGVVVWCASVVLSVPAFADIAAIEAANSQFVVRSISTNVDYIEIGNGRLGTTIGTLDTETGPVPGLALGVSAMGDVVFGHDLLRVEYDYSSGHTDYVGSYQGGTYGSVVQTSGAVFSNYLLRYGAGFELGRSTMLIPYLETGHHTWDRGVNYGELYTHRYYGAGVSAQYALGNRLVVSLEAMYGRNSESAIVVNGGGGSSGFAAALGDSTLHKAGVGVDYALSPILHVSLGVEYVAFDYGISATYRTSATTVSWEPDSRSKYTIFKFGLGQTF